MSNVISLRSGESPVGPADNGQPSPFQALDLCPFPVVVFSEDGGGLFLNQAASEVLRARRAASGEAYDLSDLTPGTLTELADIDSGCSVDWHSQRFSDDTVQVATIHTQDGGPERDLEGEAHALALMQQLLKKNHTQKGEIENIVLQAEALCDGSQAQSFVLDVMDSAVRRLQDSLLDMTSQASSAENQAAQAMTAAASSQESVLESLKTMESMDASSKQIENLAQLLQGVAKQTSLLALNAAIEAARVGDDGRGFAVIADEIRQLSAKAKAAVTEVSTLVQQTETWISEGVELSQLVSAGLQQISDTADATLTEISGIHSTVQQQAVEATKTYRSVHEVIDLAETNGVSADEIVDHCRRLRTTTDEIIQVVETD